MTHQRIDDRQARFLAKALQENTVVSVVVLSCFAIVDDGAYALASVLAKNHSIKKIQLRDLRHSREVVTFFQEICGGGDDGTNHNNLEEFSLRHCQICPKGCRILKEFLQKHKNLKEARFVDTQFTYCGFSEVCQGLHHNSSVLRLYLINTEIDADLGARCLSLLLQTNNTLEELYLSENRLGDEGTEILSDGLIHNCSVRKLDLRSNGIETDGCRALSSVVKECNMLTSLCLAMNEIGDIGVSKLAEGLKDKNCQLEDLDLSDNRISEDGAVALSDMLLENSRLQSLNLSFNSIGGNGASSIANVLDRNITLRRLCLRRNNIDNIGASAFATMLPTMRGLKELSMTHNPIDQEGSGQLLEGLRNNVELIYMQVGDTKSVQILKEIFHWIRLNQAGRRVFRDSNLPLALWPFMLSRLTKDTDVMYHFLSQKPELLEPSKV